jgi:hypothetical protein
LDSDGSFFNRTGYFFPMVPQRVLESLCSNENAHPYKTLDQDTQVDFSCACGYLSPARDRPRDVLQRIHPLKYHLHHTCALLPRLPTLARPHLGKSYLLNSLGCFSQCVRSVDPRNLLLQRVPSAVSLLRYW